MRGCRSRMPPTGDLAHNPSLCPDLGIKPGTLWFEAWRWMHCATPAMAPYVFIHFKGRERRRNEKDQSEIGCNPGMCPGRELNPLNFRCVRWDSNQVSHWARAKILRDWVWLYPLPRQSIFFYSYSYGAAIWGVYQDPSDPDALQRPLNVVIQLKITESVDANKADTTTRKCQAWWKFAPAF